MKRILIADDHAIVRKGLQETIEDDLGKVVFGHAENSPQVLEKVLKEKWDLVILDINMEGRSGLDVLVDIRKASPKMPVLILSMYPVSEFAVRALKLGAAGYLNKQGAPEELISAVRKVLEGGRYISIALAERLAAELQRDTDQPAHASLSNREMQVMRMIAEGKSLKQIAAELSISVKTVGTYHLRLMEKMGVKSDVELTRYALRNKLVD